MTTSAGLLLYRRTGAGLEVLLGHMGGPFWARKGARAWTFPKGEYAAPERAVDAAVREFTEEVGQAPPPGTDIPLGEVRQRGGKVVTAWAREGELDPDAGTPGTFELEWPPRSGRRATFPELDRLRWWTLEEARPLVVAAHEELLDRLVELVGTAPSEPSAGDAGG
jgi:predicted NUDIX family NTP pyrophosphohydrolase